MRHIGKSIGVVVGALTLVFGATASAARNQGSASKDQKEQVGDEASKHIAMVNANLESARAQADMLEEISKSDAVWDKSHGEEFVGNISRALAGATKHVEHLTPLATTSDEKEQLRLLRDRTSDAASQTKRLGSMINNREQLHTATKKLDDQLDNARDPLESLASKFNVPIDVD